MGTRGTTMLTTIPSTNMEKNAHTNRKRVSRKSINMKENAPIIIKIRGTIMIMQLTTTKNINMELNVHIVMMSTTTRDTIMRGTITRATTMKGMTMKATTTSPNKVSACKLQYYTLYPM